MSAVCLHLAMVALTGLAVPGALAEQPTELKRKVDALAQPLIEEGKAVGLAIGILDPGGTHVFGYGKVSKTADQAPDGDTVFEIGSVTKVFSALALSDMVEHKLVAFEDPIHKFLPDAVLTAEPGDHPITLLDLATHTSGLPRIPGNLVLHAIVNPGNPYARYTVDDLYKFLSKHPLSRKPDREVSYSNLGMGLLGHLLARHAGTSYEDLVVQRVCLRLGMKDTRIELSDELKARLAQGHNAAGKPMPNWDFLALAGAGALRSTANDMLLFLSANVGMTETPLSAAIEATHRPRYELGDSGGHIALGWGIQPDGKVFWHNGQTGGYHTFVCFDKQRNIGVVVLANSAVFAIDQLGSRLMQLLSDGPVGPPGVGASTERNSASR